MLDLDPIQEPKAEAPSPSRPATPRMLGVLGGGRYMIINHHEWSLEKPPRHSFLDHRIWGPHFWSLKFFELEIIPLGTRSCKPTAGTTELIGLEKRNIIHASHTVSVYRFQMALATEVMYVICLFSATRHLLWNHRTDYKTTTNMH